jgi:hypothetical protein
MYVNLKIYWERERGRGRERERERESSVRVYRFSLRKAETYLS